MTANSEIQRRLRPLRWRRNLWGGVMSAVALAQGVSAQGVSAQGVSAQGVSAQSGPATTATPVVQPLPDPNDPHRLLSAALAKLGRNPRDLEALQQAGDAALILGDVPAATGFLSRADRLLPYNPKIMASLASARLRAQDPVTAIGLFEEAEKAGPMGGDQIADRGLAYDLVSDNVAAQRYYRQALAAGAGDEAVRRLALSLAIMGDRHAVETALAPLLQKQDRAAWRIRAFAFAILGREEEAVAIANSTMPPELANAMAPYLRFMRKLTSSQQAAAANLGFFPQASVIGQDTPRIAEWIAAHGIKRLAMADQALVPAGEPLGAKQAKSEPKKDKRKPKPQAEDVAEAAPPEPTPSRESSPAAPVELVEAKPKPAAKPVAPKPAPVVVTPVASSFDLAKAPAPTPAPVGPSIEPTKAEPARAEVVAEPAPPPIVTPPATAPVETKPEPAPAPRPVVKPTPAKKPSFAELFQDLGQVSTTAVPAAGAVDIRKISAPRPVPKAPPPPPPPQHPSRIWVQVGAGRDTDKYAFDWRKLNRDTPELFKGRKPFSSDMGRTNRLVTGPFETEAEAKAFVAKLHKAGVEGSYMWVSPAGQSVDPVDGK